MNFFKNVKIRLIFIILLFCCYADVYSNEIKKINSYIIPKGQGSKKPDISLIKFNSLCDSLDPKSHYKILLNDKNITVVEFPCMTSNNDPDTILVAYKENELDIPVWYKRLKYNDAGRFGDQYFVEGANSDGIILRRFISGNIAIIKPQNGDFIEYNIFLKDACCGISELHKNEIYRISTPVDERARISKINLNTREEKIIFDKFPLPFWGFLGFIRPYFMKIVEDYAVILAHLDAGRIGMSKNFLFFISLKDHKILYTKETTSTLPAPTKVYIKNNECINTFTPTADSSLMVEQYSINNAKCPVDDIKKFEVLPH